MNCYVVALDKESSPHFLVNNIDGDELVGLEWDGHSYSIQKKMPISTITEHDFFIKHYYGLSEVKYFGIYDYLINKLTKWPYLKIRIHRWIESADQYFLTEKNW